MICFGNSILFLSSQKIGDRINAADLMQVFINEGLTVDGLIRLGCPVSLGDQGLVAAAKISGGSTALMTLPIS